MLNTVWQYILIAPLLLKGVFSFLATIPIFLKVFYTWAQTKRDKQYFENIKNIKELVLENKMNAGLISTLLSITDKLLDKMPDYDQKKRKEYFDLKLSYLGETKKLYPDRDDDLIMNLRDQLSVWVESFNQELEAGK